MAPPSESGPERRGADRPTEQQPLTLEQLSGALAEMLGQTADPATGPSSSTVPLDAEDQAAAAVTAAAAAEDCCPITPQSILEALLFVGHPANEPLRSERAAELIRGVEPREIDALVERLNAQYAAEGAPYSVVRDGAGYCLALTEEFQQVRRRFHGRDREARLSQAAVEVLALVAYNQPMSNQQISKLRGHPSSHILSHLVRRQMLRMEREPERPRTPVYYTTSRFLKFFGLASLDELPQTQELEK